MEESFVVEAIEAELEVLNDLRLENVLITNNFIIIK